MQIFYDKSTSTYRLHDHATNRVTVATSRLKAIEQALYKRLIF